MLLEAFCAGISLHSVLSNGLALLILGGLVVAESGESLHFLWLSMVLLGGLLWGLGPLLLLPRLEGAAVAILLVIIVFGTIMGPYASMPGVLYVRLAATGLPTLLAVALNCPPRILFVCTVVTLWLILRTDIWRGYHRLLRLQLELQLALEARQAQLEQANRSKEAANRRLQEMAETDPLTGVANRRHFMRRLAGLRGPAALVLMDVDHFKSVNDQLGHEAGDRVLVELAEQARAALRDGDLLARLGGEEFGVILSRAEPADAWAVAERIRSRIEAHDIENGSAPIRVTVSLGIASLAAGAAADGAALLREADAALYTAKHLGRNRISQPAPTA